MIWDPESGKAKSTEECLCDLVARALSPERAVKVEVKQMGQPNGRSGEFTHHLVYFINGKEVQSIYPPSDDKESMVFNYARSMSDYLKEHLKDATISGPQEGQDFFIVRYDGPRRALPRVSQPAAPTEEFKLPAGQYDRWQVGKLLGMAPFKLQRWFYDDSDKVDAGTVHDIARTLRKSKKLEENYQKYLNSKRPTSE